MIGHDRWHAKRKRPRLITEEPPYDDRRLN
jgi:hypothetical protein